MSEKKPQVFTFGEVPKEIAQMDKEFAEFDKQEQEANLQVIKERNAKARLVLKKFSEPIVTELEDIEFTLKPITVGVWDLASEDGQSRENPKFQSIVVRECLISPKLSDEEFNLLPAGLKYKLFMFLLQDFFLIAGKVKKKN